MSFSKRLPVQEKNSSHRCSYDKGGSIHMNFPPCIHFALTSVQCIGELSFWFLLDNLTHRF